MPRYRYQQLEQEFAAKIQQQRLLPGDRLPSVRQLCLQREVSKATVLRAYERLEARGLIAARAKSGYFVVDQEQRALPEVQQSHELPTPALVTTTDLMRDLMARSAAFDLTPGADGNQSTPAGLVALNRSVGRALRRQRGMQHQYYDEPAGDKLLRQQLSLRLRRRGCQIDESALTITSGCQHALFLALSCCCQPGDLVAVESPGFYGVLQLLEVLGLKVLEIPAAADTGLNVDALEQALDKWPIKACVVTPCFATPTGSLMPEQNRRRLLQLAEQHQFTLVEDDIYGELSFDAVTEPLKARDLHDRVILCGSVSKSLSRDLRVGWVASERFKAQLQRQKMVTVLAGSRFSQQGLAEYLEDGGYDRHLRQTNQQLQDHLQQLTCSLQNWAVPHNYRRPQGGLALWLELPEQVDTIGLYQQGLKHGLVLTSGRLFTTSERYQNCLRISFAHPYTGRRLEGLEMLSQLLEQVLE